MKESKLKSLGIRTEDTFVAANGAVVRYQDIFDGIKKAFVMFASKNGDTIPDSRLQDAMQDAFKRAVKYHAAYDPSRGSNPKGYGYRIGRKVIINLLEDVKAKSEKGIFKVGLTSYNEEDDEYYVTPEVEEFRGYEFAADHDLLVAELNERVERALSTLKELYRQPMELCLQGYKTGEIADELDITPEVAWVRLSKARKAFREALGPAFLAELRERVQDPAA